MKTNTYTVLQKVLILFIFLGITTAFAQANGADGDYCPGPGDPGDEYGDGLTFIPDMPGSGTCAIAQVWAKIDIDNGAFKLGFMNGNSGRALFRIYIDSDNDPSTGLLTETGFGGDPFPVAGAEYILEIDSLNGDTVLYQWTSGTNYDPVILNGLIGNNGDSNDCGGGDGKFLEFYIPFDEIDYDPCDAANPGEINIAQYASVSGGSPNSNYCLGSTLNFGVELSGMVTPDQTICQGELPTQLTLTIDSNNPTVSYWEESTDGINYTQVPGNTAGFFNYTPPGPFSPGTYYYRAQIVNNDICVDEFASAPAVITVIADTEDPVFDGPLPGDLNLECGDVIPTAPTLTATDNCDDNVDVSFNESSAPGCGNTETITRTWTATDGTNSVQHVQIITITDTVDPSWVNAPSNMTVQCDGTADPSGAFAAWLVSFSGSDTCGNATVSNNSSGLSNLCGATGSATVTFTLADDCGNDITANATFTIEDTTPPSLTGGANGTAECTGSDPALNATYIAWRDGFAGITGSDNCGTATMSFSEGSWSSNGCTDSITVTFTATDDCGLEANQNQTFTISDSTVPTLAGGANGTAECTGSDPALNPTYIAWRDGFAGVTGSDICGAATMSFSEGSWNSTACTDTIIVTFIATDECGLTSSQNQTFTISDTTPPGLFGGANGSAESTGPDPALNADYIAWRNNFGGITTSDVCGNATLSYSEGSWQAAGCGEQITVAFTAEDECGLTSSQNLTFTISDSTPPTLNGGADGSAECTGSDPSANAAYIAWRNNFAGITSSDISGSTTLSYAEGSWISTGCTDTITVTFTAEDDCALTASQDQTFVISDTSVPTIDTQAADSTVECDGSGNTAALNAWLASNGGAAASDICGGVTWTNNFTALSDDCGNTGSATVTFTATDECGLSSTTSATFTIEDTTAPNIDTQAAPETVECDGSGNTADLNAWLASNGGAAASDDCSGVTWSNDYTALSDDCGNTGSATVTFTATDACGLSSTTSATFTIEDTTVPNIDTAAGDSTVECDGSGNTAALNAWLVSNGGAAASDDCSGVTWTNDFTALSDDCGNTGSATVTFTATDECGLSSTTSATFTIEDTTVPNIDTAAGDSTVECDGSGNTAALNAWLASNGGAAASDDCSGVTWTNDFTALSDDCGNTGSATVTFTATDACGLSSTTSATFTIEDTTAPKINTAAGDSTVECDGGGNTGDLNTWLLTNGGAAASDDCSGVTWTNNFTPLSDDCGSTGSVTVTFTATDACGLASTTSATFTIEDTNAPTIDTQAAPETVECDGSGNTAALNAWLASNGGAAASDDCSGVTWTNDFTTLSDDCGNTGSATVTFTATDACGLSSTTTATFTIEDTTVPNIDTAAGDSRVECDGSGNTAALNAWLASNGGAAASDDCSGVTWTNDFTALSDDCGNTGSASVTFTATDACGLSSTTTATFTIEDTTPPTIDTIAAPETVECDGSGNTAALNAWLASNGGAAASDDCSGVTWTNDFTALSDDCGNTGSASVTFTATDACGLSSTTTATFTIEDTTPPTIDTQAAPETVECDGSGNTAELNAWLASNAGAAASDDCSGVTWTNDFTALSDDCGNTGSASVTFTATDACGLSSTTTATFTIEDTTPPTINTQAAPETVECDGSGNTAALNAWLASNGGAAASDDCSGVTWTNDFTALSDDCGNTGSASVTFTATDACGLSSTTTATFTIEDTTPPTIDTQAAPETVECDGSGNTAALNAWLASNGGAAASDDCSGVTWTNDFTALSDDCGNTGSTTVTFTATDACGLSSTTSATFTIEDTTPPTIDNANTSNIEIECGIDDPNDLTLWLNNNAGATASDDCSSITWSNDYGQDTNVQCDDGAITVTFTATDECGLSSSTTATYLIKDTEDPVIGTVASDQTVQCDGAGNLAELNTWLSTNAGAVATDNCSTIQWSNNFIELSDECGATGKVLVTFTATDACGNSSSTDALFTIIDTVNPEFTVPADIELFTDADCNYDISVANVGDVTDEGDDCSPGIEATYEDSVVAGQCEGTFVITRTWTLVDDCDNTTIKTQTITISDNTAPTFTAPASVEIFTDADCNFDVSVDNVGDVTDEADNCSTGLQATYVDSEPAAGPCEGTYVITRTWSLSDNCGNPAEDQVQTITISDNTAPTFTAPASVEIFTDADCNFDVSVDNVGDVTDEADNCSTGLQATYVDSEPAAGPCEGTYVITRTWSLSDNCGNPAEDQVQTITISDNTAPTFTAPASVEIFTDADCNFDVSVDNVGDVTDEADNCSTGLQATYVDSEPAAGPCEGTYVITRTWSLSDNCGNPAEDQVQTITISDNTAPTFTAPASVEIFTDADCNFDVSVDNVGDVTDEADNCSTGLQATYVDSEPAAGPCEGTYVITRTWSLSDNCGNPAEDQVQTITISDNTAPTFTAPASVEIFTDADCNFDVSVDNVGDVTDEADNCSTGLQATYVDSEPAAGPCEGTYVITRTWSLSDNCGNPAEDQVQTITISDNTAPTFTAPASVEIFTDADCNFDVSVDNVGDVTDEADNCSTGLQATYVDSEPAAGPCEGTYVITRTWSLSDNCGNPAEDQVQTITISDNTAPTFTAPADITINCEDNESDLAITGDVTDASDNCSTGIQATFSDTIADGNCPNEKVITRTWSLSDNCGNPAEDQVQTITIVDQEGPQLVTEFPAPISVSCDNIPDAEELGFADNCSENVTVTFKEEFMYTTNETEEYEIKRTWTAVDECGNPTEVEQIVTVTIDEFVTQVSDDACVDDGTVDLNQYASDLDDDSSWTFVSGVGTPVLNDNIFDPSNLLDFNGDYVFSYTYTSPTGCLETTEVTINVNNECVVFPCTSNDIVISKAVTPNGDSYNQSFDIDADPNCGFLAEVKIFNRWGALIFESNSYPLGVNATGTPDSLKWEGQANGSIGNADTAPNGTYYYIVTLKNSTGDSGVGLPPFTGPVYLGTK